MQALSKTAAFAAFPTLHTDRLDLIEITQHHLEDLFSLFGNTHVTKFYNVITLVELSEAQKFIDHFADRFKDNLAIRWGIALKGESNIIGTVGYNNFIKNHRANIGYDLLPNFWNKGICTEALKSVIHFGFRQLGANRIEAEVMQGNVSSEKLLEKLGFTKEGVLRNWMYWNDRHYDMSMFSILRSDVVKQDTQI